MIRARVAVALTLTVVAFWTRSLTADVRVDEKTRVEFAGKLGRIMNIFGGRAAREGVTSTVAVRGDRRATLSDRVGEIVDLGEEKIYDLDMRRKTYRVTTFADLRRRMEESEKRAEEEARNEEPTEPPPSANQNEKEIQIDVDLKFTGQTKTVNGYDTREAVLIVTAHEKGKTLEQSGGFVVTSDSWLGPKIAAMKEIADFEQRYDQKLYGATLAGVTAEQIAAAMALYPMIKDVIGRMKVEGAKVDGTPISATVTFEAVKSAEDMAQEAKRNREEAKIDTSGGVGGVLGGLARRAVKKKVEGEPQQRATVITGTTELLKVTSEVVAGDVAIPAGFKEGR